ncbi:MAG: SDR family NAD(P)-dependent oxidoreductase [Actinomycetota bacterium]|nr:SDR family NAD(P)-dependent oxidoreductase [Actinomycetota bacterium]
MPEKEKGILITGGAGGLGGGVIRAFVEAGYPVATTYTDPEKWERLGDLKDGVLGLQVDLLDAPAVEETARRAAGELGGLHALVNLVGGFAMGPLARTPEEAWDRMIALNLKSAFFATRTALEHLLDGGRIVNVGTAAVTNRAPRLAAYVASKGGLMTLTKSLAKELKARRITANAVLPTVLDTPANRRAMPNADRSSWLLPEEVAKLPQNFADRFGWEGMVATVAGVHRDLPASERPGACVLAGNYGEAAAIDFFGPQHGIPRAISGHNSYYLWGPQGCTGETVVSVGVPLQRLEEVFGRVEQADTVRCLYCMPDENDLPVYVSRDPRVAFEKAWPRCLSRRRCSPCTRPGRRRGSRRPAPAPGYSGRWHSSFVRWEPLRQPEDASLGLRPACWCWV